jgi:pyruvate,water dikinase
MGNEELIGMFEGALVAGNMMKFRERTKTNLVRVINESRVIFYELGNRMCAEGCLNEPTHIFMLLDEELESFIANPEDFTDKLAERASDYEQLWTVEPPFFVKDGNIPPITEWEVRGEDEMERARVGETLQGVPGCSGIYRGIARVVTDPADPRGLEPGEILVAPLTDPAWTPLFMTAGAVVVNVGGQISHAVIVSRELGLPCVVAATDATKRIPDGAEIEVNGDTGQVTLLS